MVVAVLWFQNLLGNRGTLGIASGQGIGGAAPHPPSSRVALCVARVLVCDEREWKFATCDTFLTRLFPFPIGIIQRNIGIEPMRYRFQGLSLG